MLHRVPWTLRILLTFCLQFWFANGKSQTIEWTGNGDGINWSDPLNWSTNNLPTSTDDVLIANTNVLKDSVVCNIQSDIKSLKINSDNILFIQNNICLFFFSFHILRTCYLTEQFKCCD